MLRAETPQEQFNLIGAGRRNMIINGDMQISQRGTSFAAVNGTYSLDRYIFWNTIGAFTITQDSDTPPGFGSSLKLDCTTANASPSASSYIEMQQKIEGYNLQALKKGSSDALPVTLSFWVKTNKTGTYQVNLIDYSTAAHRTMGMSYDVTTADTWQKITITFPGDAIGELANSNTSYLAIDWWWGSSSTYGGGGTTQTSWGTMVQNLRNGAGTVNLGDSTANYFNMTGVQLELGKVATPFEHRSYGEELALCQRYFHTLRGGISGVATAVGTIAFTYSSPVTMRATPTIGFKDSNDDIRVGDMVAQGHNINTCTIGTTTYSTVESQSWSVSGTPSAPQAVNLVSYRTYLLEPNSSNHGTFTFSAEL